jgi:hypothetical protein
MGVGVVIADDDRPGVDEGGDAEHRDDAPQLPDPHGADGTTLRAATTRQNYGGDRTEG